MRNRVLAWLNLARHFGIHVLVRMPVRALGGSRDDARFRAAVVSEGYVPLAPAERALMPAAMSCIHCGLCSLACPALREAPASAHAEAWTFVAGPSRALDRAALVAPAPCTRCTECDAVCPTGVPITMLAALVSRLGQGGTALLQPGEAP